jgi:cytochrome c-type biogenesis protein CcsB
MKPEISFFWIAVSCYGVSAFSYIIGLMARKEALFNLGMALSAVGLICHVTTVALRWITGGVLPFIEISESLTSGVLIAVLIFLIIQFSSKKLKAVGVLVMPVCFILLGWAGTLIKDIGATLPASLQSQWLWVHIIGASTGFSAVLTAAALGLLFLLKERNSGGVYEKIPDLETLDDLGYRFIGGGFIMLGLMIVSGSLWSNQVKGSYWNWDPVEVWSLITWLTYGIYLHLRITMGWRNRRLAIYALAALGIMIVSYWGIPFVKENFHTGFRIEHK